MRDIEILQKVKDWLDANVEEQSLPLAVRQDVGFIHRVTSKRTHGKRKHDL
jgi:hypothetical protein